MTEFTDRPYPVFVSH